ncbi:MAG TPA: hypothetical protein DD635_01465 [Flavobacteriales bacterium]|nr:hypothetical protein [Flavobacteriales bacterium]
MIYLLTSIAFSAGIFILFQRFTKWNVNTLQAIVINYAVAAASGWVLSGGRSLFVSVRSEQWVWIALTNGLLFIYLFHLIARSTQELGLTVTSIATKLSMVIPVALFLTLDPSDILTWKKGLAIILTIPAIVFASWKDERNAGNLGVKNWLIPLVIFIGSGCIDLMFAAYSKESYMQSVEHRYMFASLPMATACVTGILWLLGSGQIKTPSPNTLMAGLGLGIINFGSLYFLLETYDKLDLERSGIIPVNNLGVILLSAAASVLFLGERLNKRNQIGLALGMLVIFLLLSEA